ncbi:polysaccharide biosynthesis tyrosine autokinase [Rhizobium sp. CC-YZS058]|uniref:polysaccharide biosynthesis tyrosine autokinase n=1 Tax=Rhizobium sp. CC-YZS058 TaxID=3042153 RepID=UPI002B0594A3|nr:polysaccharide biosynthesis tyrosine autokinase [Rhizobium sp. CC-YZS058]MEA3535459.1 polysaccharide biosynthesis tyrosine autokinase [Rhizobium sp. CC-YZS058]
MQVHNRDLANSLKIDLDQDEQQAEPISFDALGGMLRRQWLFIAGCVMVAMILGMAYTVVAVPYFTSKVTVLIDRGNSQVVEQLSLVSAVTNNDAYVLSQVELLKSDTIALAVVDKLDLSSNPQFMAKTGSLVSSVKAQAGSILEAFGLSTPSGPTPASAEAKRREAAARLKTGITVSRVGRTYALAIEYVSTSPVLASQIANALGDAYLFDKLNSKYDATRRAGFWLQDRIGELRQKSLETDLALQRFKAANGLVAAGKTLVSDQQLSEFASGLVLAQAETARARARLEQIEKIVSSGQSDAIVSDVLKSSISEDLRRKYLAASKLQTEIAAKLGPQHVAAVRVRSEMEEYKRLMFEEVSRIAESYRSDLSVAEAREKEIQDKVAAATQVTAVAGETMVQMRELEREAETYRDLYQTFLQRHQEAVQQQSFPVTEARIITKAVPVWLPTSPRKSLTLALSIVLGLAAGSAIGAFREFRDRFFRTGDHVRSALELEYLGIGPLIEETGRTRAEPQSTHPHQIHKTSAITNYVVDHPLSAFAETLRSAKIAIDLTIPGKECKIIGVVSGLPGEGKSTVSINFAELLASQGVRTVLVDADFRNPGATRALAAHAESGILEALIEGRNVRSLLMRNLKTKLSFLPLVSKHRVAHSSELLSSPVMRNLLAELSKDFDYIVLDLPPLGPVVDARAIAHRIDGFIMVVEWGKITRRAARQILDGEPQIFEKCIGVILNKVDQKKMKLYQTHGSTEYYGARFAQYYHENDSL